MKKNSSSMADRNFLRLSRYLQISTHVAKWAQTFFQPGHGDVYKQRDAFLKDFENIDKMTLHNGLLLLQKWHERLTKVLASRPTLTRLEDVSPYLSRFR